MFSGQMPDITPAQIIAVVGSVITVAIAFGVHITKQQQDALLAMGGAVAAVLIAADAHLRGRRAHAHAIRYAADVQAAAAATRPAAAPTPATSSADDAAEPQPAEPVAAA